MTDKNQKYDESSIQVLKGLEPVQQRPGMYTRLDSPTHIIQEVIDNACDEALGGYANKIAVKVHQDHSVSVSDNGRGIPVGMHPTEGAPVLELVFTKLHAGGKFNKQGDASAYKYSGGLHGVGVSVTNALTDRLEVNVKREGAEHVIVFEKGAVTTPLKKIGKVDKQNSGTSVRAWPTIKYFDSPHVSVSELENMLRAKAMLLPGVEVTFEEEGKEPKIWHYPEGMPQYMNDVAGSPEWLFPPLKMDGEDLNPEGGTDGLTCVIGFSSEGNVFRESFVNLIPTKDGGRHMQGMRYGAFMAVQQFMERQQLLPKNLKLEYDDVWSRMSCVLAMRMVDPQFQGQTKDQLSSKHAAKLVEKIISAQFELWLHEHPQLAKQLAELVTEQAQKRSKTAPKADRKRSNGGAVLPGKLTDCESSDVNHTELFLVEGDSAGGCIFFTTLIPLADGRTIQVGDMVEEQKTGKRHFVYPSLPDGGVGIEEAINARMTKRGADLVEVLLDNGKSIKCTPDHKFMLRSGEFVEAQHLQEGQSLMPLYKKVTDKKPIIGYEQVFDNAKNKWVYSHLLADQWNLKNNVYEKLSGIGQRIIRHHKDFVELNNAPTNIVQMGWDDHIKLHQEAIKKVLFVPEVRALALKNSKTTMKSKKFRDEQRERMMSHESWDLFRKRGLEVAQTEENIAARKAGFQRWCQENPEKVEEFRKNATKVIQEYWSKEENREAQSLRTTAFFENNPEAKVKAREVAKEQWGDEELKKWRAEETKKQWTPEFRVQRKAALAKTYYNKTIATLKLFCDEKGDVNIDAYHASEAYQANRTHLKWESFVSRYFETEEQAKQAVALFNHKVVSVTPLDYTADVYDIEVPNTHNFATDAGVFIHNSAKMGRDRKIQAILPLRGKLLNTWSVETEKLDSKTIEDIIIAVGVEPHSWGDAVNFENLRYGKIIIMSDADVDGRHIQVLILTLFLRHFPELVRRGHVYLAQPPLFRVDAPHSKRQKNPMRKIYALDQGELDDILKRLGKEGIDESQLTINRFKGLGEMNADQLCETTMQISTRRLVQPELTEETWKQVTETFDMMMNEKNASLRRAWMERDGNKADMDI
jgi:DNA gyrase subunit B